MNDATATGDHLPHEVPSYDTHAFAAKRSDYCVCVFVINENGRLHQFLDKTRPLCDRFDIVIADGGSSDGSTEQGKLRELGVNTLLVKTGPGKLGAQMRMAFDWALARGYRGVIVVDGNDKDDPAALPQFAELLDQGFDHIQGSRFIPGGISENLPVSRYLALKLIHAPMMRRASGFNYTDTTNGFRGYSAKLLSDPRLQIFRDVFSGYETHYYLALRAAQLGFRVCETPVARRYPAKGPTPTKIGFFRGNWKVLKCLFNACRGYYNPPPE
jgi:glycosyltransferase involved in cell wall biosynthesis